LLKPLSYLGRSVAADASLDQVRQKGHEFGQDVEETGEIEIFQSKRRTCDGSFKIQQSKNIKAF
jgi:hypothetical protein